MAAYKKLITGKEQRALIKRLCSYLFKYRLPLILTVASGLVGVFLTVLGPRLLGTATNVLFSGLMSQKLMDAGFKPGTPKSAIIRLMDAHGMGKLANMVRAMSINLKEGMDWRYFAVLLIWVGAIYVAAVALRIFENWLLAKVIAKSVFEMRRQIEEKINRLPLSYFDSVPRGEIMSTTTNDLDNITTSLQQVLSQLLFSAFMIFGVVIMMFTISWIFTLCTMGALCIVVLITKIFINGSKPAFAAQWQATGDIQSQVEEVYSGNEVIKAYNQQKEVEKAFDKRNRRFYKVTYKAQSLSGAVNPVDGFLGNIIFVAIVIIGGIAVIKGDMSLGDLQAFAQYSRQIQRPVVQLASMSTSIQSALASCKRFFDFLDAQNEEDDEAKERFGEGGKKFEGRVAFENVYFSYVPEDPLIKDLNLTALPGQTIAIVGPTGAGKTTIVNLLMRFYEIQKGEIKVSGINAKDVSRKELRSHFGMVLQDTWLFRGTIRDNLLYGLKPGREVNEEEFMEACRKTHVDDFVSALKNGYETMLDSDASQLSQGERQLLTICRAYISQPDILILDEATSSVDTRTEMLVQQAMNSLSQNRTSFVIAHRLSTIRDADVILVVNHGNIVEKGSHDELLEKNGEYAKLYRSQFVG
ncbi:MAG: ABC transporter ATP-binding protein [Aeriscardovia sp.]|nr:ABC transporter ATP-binding protein [Aeriscardovia sp.]